jgi:hypothetical protein
VSDRTTARLVGVLFIIASAGGVLAGVVQLPIIDADDYLTRIASEQTRLATGLVLELIMGIAVVALVAVLHPILRRHSQPAAVGFTIARTIEAVMYGISAIGLLSLLTISRAYVDAGSPAGSHHETLGELLLAAREWGNYTIQMIAFASSALVLNAVLHRARLVPRWLSTWGMVGAVLFLAVGFLVMYGLEPFSVTQLALVVPLGIQEMVFAIWLIAMGFSEPLDRSPQLDRHEASLGVTPFVEV